MNLNNIESAGNFEEIFEKVSKDFNIFVKDLQEDFSEFSTQNEKEIQNLKDQLASLKKVQKETAEEKRNTESCSIRNTKTRLREVRRETTKTT